MITPIDRCVLRERPVVAENRSRGLRLSVLLCRSPRRSNDVLEDGEIREDIELKEHVQPKDAGRDAKRSRPEAADMGSKTLSTTKRSNPSDAEVPKKNVRLSVDLSQLLADGAAATRTVLEVREQERREKARFSSGLAVPKPGMQSVKSHSQMRASSDKTPSMPNMVERMRGNSGEKMPAEASARGTDVHHKNPVSNVGGNRSGSVCGTPAAGSERTKPLSQPFIPAQPLGSGRPVIGLASQSGSRPASQATSGVAKRAPGGVTSSSTGPPSGTSSTIRRLPRALM